MDRALEEAGIDRKHVYVTNAVKHFKWEPRGKRRIHKKSNAREIAACRPWLEAELRVVKPKLVVCLGATAAQTVFGPSFRVTRERGKILSSKLAPKVMATVHPSSLLRQPDEASRDREYAHLVSDLRAALRAAGSSRRQPRKLSGWSRGDYAPASDPLWVERSKSPFDECASTSRLQIAFKLPSRVRSENAI